MQTIKHTSSRTPARALVGVLAAGALSLTLAACGDTSTNSTAAEDPNAADPADPAGETTMDETATDETATDDTASDAAAVATVQLADGQGEQVGTAEVSEVEGAMQLMVDIDGLEAGFHALHIHAVGQCEADEEPPEGEDPAHFTSAGGHLGSDTDEHPDHAGDLPSLLVMEDGTASLTFTTDRFTLDDLTAEEGTALMVHGGRDNYANVPERYLDGQEPDADTLATGDAGSRVACGVIEATN